MARWTCDLSAPGWATTLMASNLPTSPRILCAVGSSKAASVAPARLFAVPKRVSPEMVKVCVGPRSRIRTCWPTEKPYFLAVPRSITTSCGVVGGPPAASRSGDSCWAVSQETPRVGAPPVEIAVPSWLMNCAVPATVPSATCTPGTARTVASRDSGTGLRVAPPPLPS